MRFRKAQMLSRAAEAPPRWVQARQVTSLLVSGAGILSISNRLTGYMLPCLFQHGATVRVRKDRAVWEYW